MQKKAKKISKFANNQFDFILCITVILLLALGIIMVLSASAPSALSTTGNSYTYVKKQLIFAIAGIATAIGPLLLGLGGLLKILPLVVAGFTAMTGPIGIAVMAITAAATLIITHWDEIKTASRNVVEYVKKMHPHGISH